MTLWQRLRVLGQTYQLMTRTGDERRFVYGLHELRRYHDWKPDSDACESCFTGTFIYRSRRTLGC